MKKFIISLFLITAAFVYSYGSGDEIGKIYKVNAGKREVLVSPDSGQKLNMGDRLQVETAGGKVELEVTFPMLTVSKCRVKGNAAISRLSKGMSVSRYSKDEAVVKPAEKYTGDPVKGIYLRKIPGNNLQYAVIGEDMTASITNVSDTFSDIDGAMKALAEPQYKGKYTIDGDILTITGYDSYQDETVYKGKFNKDWLELTCYKHMNVLRNDEYHKYQLVKLK